jgi:hypothetical protein
MRYAARRSEPRRRSDGHVDSVMVNLLIVDADGEADKGRLVRRRRQRISAIN